MTGDGTVYWEAHPEVAVTRVTLLAGDAKRFKYLGNWEWDEPSRKWFFAYAEVDEDNCEKPGFLDDADRRAIEVAEPTDSPVVRLEVDS